MSSFDFNYLAGLFPILFRYLGITLQMAAMASVIALALALVLALIRVFKLPLANSFVVVFISFFRGTPLLVQLFILYYGLPQLIPALIGLDAFSAAVIGLSLHFSAYMAESLRAAIQAVPRSQWEASYAFGMTRIQALRRIVLPQAVRTALPSLMNYLIDLLKSTSLAFTLGLAEIMAKAQMEASSSFKFFESYLAVALIYWGIVLISTHLQSKLEAHLSKAY
ncbi:amino acid ABC transporter permease [Aliagarivorans marinus]|uniref:amino acid ABC transporter permease n=1 Tax=Aliagarivorans marinus TaxID=561965 RepID=UPI00040BBA9D|nr:amino acid ABC transporter permease [Aliagarivorans marinus]